MQPFSLFTFRSPQWQQLMIIIMMLCATATALAQSLFETRVPSEIAGSEGIFVRINRPNVARYGALGAPVVIHIAGGFGSTGLTVANPPWSLPDCIEIRFNFPGGGTGTTRSGGVYDDRGPNCLKALRDVIRFALGTTTDVNGKKLSELVSPIQPLAANVGLVGWSNGGNATIAVAGLHGSEIAGLAWIVNWESPVGDGMPGAECGANPRLGATNPTVNPAYNPDTGEFDFTMLAYNDTVTISAQGPPLRGGLYFDVTGNGVPNLGVDFILHPHAVRTGNATKAYYSNRVIKAATAANLLPNPVPAHIATAAETEEFWRPRNGESWFADAVRYNPQLMFLVEASESDHVQSAPDHPHVLIQYEGFRLAGARFVRLNPDRAYVESVLSRSAPSAVDNDAFLPFDHLSIRSALEPAGVDGVPTNVGVAAAIYELADRTQTNNVSPQLEGVLTSVKSAAVAAPSHFQLEQNYPNPFNHTTQIRYHLDHSGPVRLCVYDMLGRETVKLVNEVQEDGTHEIPFDGSSLASGLYFYRLECDGKIKIHRIMLLR